MDRIESQVTMPDLVGTILRSIRFAVLLLDDSVYYRLFQAAEIIVHHGQMLGLSGMPA